MLTLALSPIEAQAVLTWARLDRLTSREPDAALQLLAGRVRDAIHADQLAGGLTIDVEPSGQKAQAPAPVAPGGRPACLTAGCRRPTESRGLCSRCYAAAYKAVGNGGATWEGLERVGRAAPKVKE